MKKIYFVSIFILFFSQTLMAQCGGGGWKTYLNKTSFGVPAKNKVYSKIETVDGYPAIVFNKEIFINSVKVNTKEISTNTYSSFPKEPKVVVVEEKGDQLLIVDDEIYEKIYNGWYVELQISITIQEENSIIKICKCFE